VFLFLCRSDVIKYVGYELARSPHPPGLSYSELELCERGNRCRRERSFEAQNGRWWWGSAGIAPMPFNCMMHIDDAMHDVR
jgi:hypothetical protein